MRETRWTSFGVAFLLSGAIGAVIALVEQLAARHLGSPTIGDLLYAVDFHLLIMAIIAGAARLLGWRLSTQAFVPLVLAGALAVELGIVGAYWLCSAPFMPDLTSRVGRIAGLVTACCGVFLASLIALLLYRSVPQESWGRVARSRAAPTAALLAVVLIVVNAAVFWRVMAVSDSVGLRPDAAQGERPDVVVILVDTLRRDHLSCFGYNRPTSPNLDRLYGESWVFTNAYVPSTYTTPTVASLFTGLYPSSHRILDRMAIIPETAPMLAEHFRSYGYATGAFVANGTITARCGFAQGFETYFPMGTQAWCRRQRTAFEQIIIRALRPNDAHLAYRITAEASRWMQENAGRPRFAYIHYMEPHEAYRPSERDRSAVAPDAPPGPHRPPNFVDYRDQLAGTGCQDWECLPDPPRVSPQDLEGMVANYDGEIRSVDRYIGRLLDDLADQGVLDRCELVFCSDHGEEFGDHHGWAHVNSIYEEMSACPLMYRPPGGLPKTRTIARPVGLLDVIPTLCSRAGIEAPPIHQGLEIPELLGRDHRGPAQPVLCERPDQLFSLRLHDWKLIRRGALDEPEWRLFDLGTDPLEQCDLAADHPDTVSYLRAHLEGLVLAYEETSLGAVSRNVDPELLRQLRDLGYIK